MEARRGQQRLLAAASGAQQAGAKGEETPKAARQGVQATPKAAWREVTEKAAEAWQRQEQPLQ